MYRPSDSYCIHVDAKASDTVKKAVDALVRCYNTITYPKYNNYVHIYCNN